MVSKAFTVSAKMKTNVVALWFVGALFLNLMGASSSSYNLCENKNCSGTPIVYPFGLGNKGCGHPNFQLNCNSNINFPEMVFMNHTYIIKDIFYTASTATIQDAIVAQGPELNLCSLGNSTVSFGLQNSDLSPVSGFSVLSFFVNCTTKPSASLSEPYSRLASCGSKTTSAAMLDTDSRDVDKMKKSCKSVYQVALQKQFPNTWVNASENHIKNQITFDNLKVRWKIDTNWIDKCNLCNATFGVCGYNTTDKSFLCHCKDGSSHQSVCRGNSTQSAPTTNTKGNNLAIILGIVGSSLALLVLALCLSIICRRSKRLKRLVKKANESFLDKDTQITFGIKELIVATNNFDEKLKLGEGGFGVVYKGCLYEGKEIAVKKLSLKSSQGMQEFMAEIRLLANIQHKNLVSLLGCCKEANHLILVYEYLSNRSLDNFIFDSHTRELLNWAQRYNIIIGIGRGLKYLHEDLTLKIIHRDIKASNILLDERFNPKIADFGLARLFDEDKTHVHTEQVAGTRGYMAPEYVLHGLVSAKADVYSFGVLVLEIIGGRKNIDSREPSDTQYLVEWTRKLHQQASIFEMIDETMRDAYNHDQVAKCIHLAVLCTQDDFLLRPTMSEVLLTLSSHVDVSELPNPSSPKLFNFSCGESLSSTGDHSFLPNSSKGEKSLISSHNP